MQAGYGASKDERNFQVPTWFSRTEGHTGHAALARRVQTWRGRRPQACTDTRGTGIGRARVWPPAYSWGPHGEPPGDTTMLDGRGQSDSPIVAERPPNKRSGAPGRAEGVERRELAKGNVAVHTTGRTQCRRTPAPSAGSRTAGPFECLRVMTRGRSPVRESRTPGSVRGVPSNRHPYRDRRAHVIREMRTLRGYGF